MADIDITVIDDSDFVGFAAAATRTGEVYMDSAASMVKNVLARAGESKIRRLNILDHGNQYSFSLGSDWIDLKTLPSFEPTLVKLRPAFGASGFVHLQHCDIGMNRALLVALAKVWDVSVFAGTGAHNPVYRFNFGSYVRADPNGAVRPSGRPDEETYQTYIGMRDGELPFVTPREEPSTRFSSVAYETIPPLPPAPLKPKRMRRRR